MHERVGIVRIASFEEYMNSLLSICMSKELTPCFMQQTRIC